MQPDIPAVQVDELPAELPGEHPGGAVLLDVREDNEFAAGHAPGAAHLPMSTLPGRIADLPEAERYYVVCRSGGRSAQVTAYLNANGRQAHNVAGGMQAWAQRGLPMRSETGEPPAVV